MKNLTRDNEVVANCPEEDYFAEEEAKEREDKESKFKSIVRPGSVVVMLVFFMFIVLADGNWGSFSIKPGYYPLIETVVTTVVLAFFGMRGIEKTAREWQQNDYRHRQYRRPRSSPRPRDYEDRDERDT